ncbi:hypothetical protein, conserved [Babesia ovata]|uniref:Uncharacterized protein n=1 Tax=Babesia ovata TaxID=189622 RepID=A0A2H6K6B7_9APIC|nr:uncharacterized protein BOVATA_000230 [Babesia ovata]GBE58530.1 hypothetical protein, conserved [Babesia ovata]
MNYGHKAAFLLFTVAWLGVTANAVWYCVTLKWAFEAPVDCFGRGLDSYGKCPPLPTPEKPSKGPSEQRTKKTAKSPRSYPPPDTYVNEHRGTTPSPPMSETIVSDPYVKKDYTPSRPEPSEADKYRGTEPYPPVIEKIVSGPDLKKEYTPSPSDTYANEHRGTEKSHPVVEKTVSDPDVKKEEKLSLPEPSETDKYRGLEQKPPAVKSVEDRDSVSKDLEEEKTLRPVIPPEKAKLPVKELGGESPDLVHKEIPKPTHEIPDPVEKTLKVVEPVPKVVPEVVVKKPGQAKKKKAKTKIPKRSVRPDGLSDDWQ